MNNEKFQDLMLEHFGEVLNKLDSVESRLSKVESELSEVKQSQATMEKKFMEKLEALYFD
ncbi:hypothetical protein [Desulfosporosinus metallidurans]|uniref:Chromosome partition protein smc n=1 Tax=Desulfosporosinus metallidurans TaxID=1888891 RepID=A0A1Q8QMK3_9FIRM|nr:hypothetical protein [Desulfosporosinus metallidurans]OLN28498.1 Chromosome partition protein smc [Desulfosporosinus metallidurans]